MSQNNLNIKGLTTDEVNLARVQHGQNILKFKRGGACRFIAQHSEKTYGGLLLVAAAVYLFSGERGDTLFLIPAIFLISIISLFQERLSRNALKGFRK